jgi:hypothetical protein
MNGIGGVKPLPPAWALFGAGSALVAGAGAGALPEVLGRLIAPVVLVLLFRADPLKAIGAASVGAALLYVIGRDILVVGRTALPVGIGGLLLASGLARAARPGRTVLLASIPFLVIAAASYFFPGAAEMRAEEAEKAVQSTLSLYRGLEESPADGAAVEGAVREVAELAVKLTPAFEFALLLGVTAVVYAVSAAALARYGLAAPPLAAFGTWRAPFALVWVFGAGLAGVLAGRSHVREVAANLLVFTSLIYLTVGISVLVRQLRRRRLPVLFLILFLTAAIFVAFPLFPMLIACTGLFDTWFDFRKLDRAPEETEAP